MSIKLPGFNTLDNSDVAMILLALERCIFTQFNAVRVKQVLDKMNAEIHAAQAAQQLESQ